MARVIQWMLVLLVVVVIAVPAQANEITQIWECEMEDGTTEEDVEEIAQAFLSAVRKMEGGSESNIAVFFPVVVGNTGQTDFYFVMTSPSFTAWGQFWDNYNDESPAAAADEMNDGKVICPDSSLWEAVKFEAE